MAKIAYKIPEDNYSIVLQRITAILLVEFCEQIKLGNEFLPNEVSYDTDYTPDEGNIPWVAVNWLNFQNLNDNRKSGQNKNRYFIDVKAVSYETTRNIISVIRRILKSQQYDLLDFPYGIVSETNIIEAGISFEERLRDSQGVVSGGVNFECIVFESNDETVPTELNQTMYESIINESNKKITLKEIY